MSLPVVDCRRAAARQVLLRVSAHEHRSLLAAHTTPGQYVKLALEDGVPRTFSIASPPPVNNGGAEFEFLLKLPEEQLPGLLALGPDDRVQMGRPQGKGFPLEQARGKHLWLVAVGSGIAPLRAVIEHLLPRRSEVLDVTLLYGVRDPAELAFTARFGAWAGCGVRVIPVVSRPPPDGVAWDGRTGHVQDHLPKELADPERTVAFVCGLPAMERDVGAQLLARGVGPEQVFRNW